MSALGEDLHAGALVAAIADHKLAIVMHDGHLARIPELALLLAGHTELELQGTHLVKDLDAMVVRVRHNDLLVDAQTEAVRRVELTLGRAQGAEFAAYLHGRGLVPAGNHTGGAGRCHGMEVIEAHVLHAAHNGVEGLQVGRCGRWQAEIWQKINAR